MKNAMLIAGLLVSGTATARSESRWMLEASTLSYRADHKMHDTVGVSRIARGKAACGQDGCDFLVAAPVNSFDSGDTNRDTHMVQTVRGVQNPMVVVKGHLAVEPAPGALSSDIVVEIAGKRHTYQNVAFEASDAGGVLRLTGVVPMRMTDFAIEAPSLLGIAVEDDISVQIETTWKKS